MKRQDDFESRRAHLKGMSDEELKNYFWQLAQQVVDPLLELGYKNTSPAIERSVLLRMGMEPDSDKACADYEEIVKSYGGVDLQLLGLGHNGHIGFNEPADEFPKTTHCVDLQESTIKANARFFASIDDVPTQAYTMGIGTIMYA